MPRAYSQDLRASDRSNGGESRRSGARFHVSEAAIKWLQRIRAAGDRRCAGTGGHRPSKVKPGSGIADRTSGRTRGGRGHQRFRVSSLRKGSALKKTVFPAEPAQAGRGHRTSWKRYQGKIDPTRLVLSTKPRQTWCARTAGPGEASGCAQDPLEDAHICSGTAIGRSMMSIDRVSSPGSANPEQLMYFILDNLSSHKGQAIRGPSRSKVAFSAPVQPCTRSSKCSRLKTRRKAAERTVEATWKRIGSLLDEFTSEECANYLANSGYAYI